MESGAKKKQRVIEDNDKISKLSDDVIHKILSFVDAKEAVQTSVLSKRWKLVWTTLPFLNFGRYEHHSPENTYGFIRHVLSNRNHESHISELKLCGSKSKPPDSLVEKFVEYAIEHNVQDLNLQLFYRHEPVKLSTLSSNSLKKLTLKVKLAEFASELECWNLPALTSLYLFSPIFTFDIFYKLPGSCLSCLPALRTLCLDFWDLKLSSFTFSLPHLTALRLYRCRNLPSKVWNFPALLSLELNNVDFPKNMSSVFRSLVNLQNLTLVLKRSSMEKHHSISCPQLLNLNIRIVCSDSLYDKIKILAPKLRNFSSVGILSITLEVPELENVHIQLTGWFWNMDWIYRKKLYRLFTDMLSGLGNAKNLTFDVNSIEALSAADFLASLPSPFSNLKIVKLPLKYKKSSISTDLRNYLLGSSPRATIVTILPQNKILQIMPMPVSVTSQNVGLGEPLANPTVELVDSQGIHKKVCTDTLEMRLQADHRVENSVVIDGKIRHDGGLMPNTQGAGNDCASSSGGKEELGLWKGYEVNSEFVGLLDLIMQRYPETFEHFTTKSKKFCTMKLNMLCTSVNAFTTTTMTEIDAEMITEYRTLFDDLQRSFNIKWLVSRLNYIEQLHFSQNELHAIDSSIDAAKSKLLVLQNLRTEKMTKMQEAFGTMGTNLVATAGYIGDDLLPNP